MSDTIPVLHSTEVHREAFEIGHRTFEDAGVEAVGPEGSPDLSVFKDSARWANNLAPRLRALAGADDGGHGTYTQHRQVAVIPPENRGDVPAEAELRDSSRVFDQLVRSFDKGAHDALNGVDD